MKNRSFYVWGLLLCLCACGKKEPETTFQTFDLLSNLNVGVDSAKTWNDFASSVDVIPLETNDSVLLATFKIKGIVGDKIVGVNRVENRTAEGWVILSGSKADIRIFDVRGKYRGIIDRKGKGEQEYADLGIVLVGKDPFVIQVLDNRKLVAYDERGKWLRTGSMREGGWEAGYLGKDRFLMESPIYPLNAYKYQVFIADGNGQTIREMFPVTVDSLDWARMSFSRNGMIRPAPDGVWYKNAYCDTVYKVTAEGEAEIAAVFLCGEKSYSRIFEVIGNQSGMQGMEAADRLIGVTDYSVFGEHVYIRYVTDNKVYSEIWKIGEKQPLVRQTGKYGECGIALELGKKRLNVLPQWIENNKAYFIIDAYKAMEAVEGITEEDNPVLVIVNLDKL